jgi:hypothetical protein
MHILILSLLVAAAVCVLLLIALWVFTLTPRGRALDANLHGRTH